LSLDAVTPTLAKETTHGLEGLVNRRTFLREVGLKGLAALGAAHLLPAWLVASAASPVKPNASVALPSKALNTLTLEPTTLNPIVPVSFTHRLSSVQGLSEKQITQHIGLYEGYVAKFNLLNKEIASLQEADWQGANATYHPFRERHVALSFAENGAVLHELYFGNIGGAKQPPSATLKRLVAGAFGSWERFASQLTALSKSMRGWAILAYSFRDKQLHFYGLDTHHHYAPIASVPLLVVDVYEHAYMIDFGTNRAAYLEVLLSNIDWQVVEQRLDMAMQH
jgi:superoxide dismutase, Fe-Mn family